MLHASSNSTRTQAVDPRSGGTLAGNITALAAADWLSFAAAPTFAIMALLTAVLGGPPDMLCSSVGDAPALTGMVPMYVLMSAFHLAPWLRLITGRRSSTDRS